MEPIIAIIPSINILTTWLDGAKIWLGEPAAELANTAAAECCGPG